MYLPTHGIVFCYCYYQKTVIKTSQFAFLQFFGFSQNGTQIMEINSTIHSHETLRVLFQDIYETTYFTVSDFMFESHNLQQCVRETKYISKCRVKLHHA